MSVLLIAVSLVSLFWEASRDSGRVPSTGTVVKVRRGVGGNGGDGLVFTIRYRIDGERHYLVMRRGILDAFGTFAELSAGDSVPLEVRPTPPYSATVDTLTGRYGITLCFAALTLVFWTVVALVRFTGVVT